MTIDNVITVKVPNDEHDKLLILGSNTGSCSQKQANSGSVTVEASLNVWSYILDHSSCINVVIFIHLFVF